MKETLARLMKDGLRRTENKEGEREAEVMRVKYMTV